MQSACALLPSVAFLALQYFSILSHKSHDLKKNIEHEMYFLIFCTTFIWNISHSKKNWARYDQKRILVFMESTRYSCPILKNLEVFQHICENPLNMKFHEKPSSESCVVPWEWTCRRIHRPDEANSLVCNFAKRLKSPACMKQAPFLLVSASDADFLLN